MHLEVGAVLEGKVASITKFGAFISLPEGKSGLVHISEIANSFVNDVREYISEGQTVKVKVLNIGPDGKINLSIKKAERQSSLRDSSAPKQTDEETVKNTSFEDKLKQFLLESDSKISKNRLYSEKKRGQEEEETDILPNFNVIRY
jgi:S1 RNA binding domain protein